MTLTSILVALTSGWSGMVFGLLFGTTLGFLAGLVPGIGGRIGIILSIPIATFWDPLGGAVFLFAMHSVVHTATSIPAIAFALPSTASDAATVLDGYPLAKMGRAGEALGASLSASAMGGIIGALVFLAAIPVSRLLISWFGPPEFLLLAVAGLSMVALLSGSNVFIGLVVAAFGFLLALVGLDVQTSETRFTFDVLELSGGLSLAAIIGGFFVVPEMLSRWTSDAESQNRAVSTTMSDVMSGAMITFAHMRLLLRSTIYGIVIGIMPGLGSSVSAWMSYAYAAANTKSEIPFGQGAIAGVIAPEAANNSKEGGAMVPSLFFGIPGSSSMAIMLGAFVVIGQPVGPSLLTTDIHVPVVLAATVLLANVLAIPMFFAVVPHIVRLAALRREHIVPFAIAISLFAALYQNMNTIVLAQFVAASAVGVALKWAKWSRAPFLLGFILGPLVEISFIQTSQIWGWSMFFRPMSITLALIFAYTGYRSLSHRRRAPRQALHSRDWVLLSSMIAAFGLALWGSLSLPKGASNFPLLVSVVGLAISAILGVRHVLADPAEVDKEGSDFAGLLPALAFCALVVIVGVPVASFIYVLTILLRLRVSPIPALFWAVILAATELLMFWLILDIRAEPLITGAVVDWFT